MIQIFAQEIKRDQCIKLIKHKYLQIISSASVQIDAKFNTSIAESKSSRTVMRSSIIVLLWSACDFSSGRSILCVQVPAIRDMLACMKEAVSVVCVYKCKHLQ